jgi:RHS repeat-associated protein
VSGALSYEIQFAPIADGAGPGAANWGGSAVRTVQHVAPSWGAGAGPGSVLRASATGLAHDQRYAWRVRGVNPAEAGPWPEARALRTETAPGGRRYYVSDHLRSTRAVVDPAQAADPSSGLSLAAAAAQAVVEARDYYPYGLRMPGRQVLQDAQGAPQDYTGHELDEATGFHYAGARYYSSALARWGSVDPLADDFPAWSGYNYSYNNPFRFTDPTGMAPDDIIVLHTDDAAFGQGHTALLVGDDKNGWVYYSKDGPAKGKGPDKHQRREFGTLEEALKSDLEYSFSSGVRFKTTEEQDEKAKSSLNDAVKEKYDPIKSNCADLVEEGLKSAGIEYPEDSNWWNGTTHPGDQIDALKRLGTEVDLPQQSERDEDEG